MNSHKRTKLHVGNGFFFNWEPIEMINLILMRPPRDNLELGFITKGRDANCKVKSQWEILLLQVRFIDTRNTSQEE
jgi:hypothetical protein